MREKIQRRDAEIAQRNAERNAEREREGEREEEREELEPFPPPLCVLCATFASLR